jgi:adenylate cyclase
MSSGSGDRGHARGHETEVMLIALRRRASLQLSVSNIIGALLLAAFLLFVAPVPSIPRSRGLTLNLILIAVSLPASAIAGQLLGHRTSSAVTAWFSERRKPTELERAITLRQPILQARNIAALWLAAALLFSVVNAFYSGAVALETAIGITMGGIVTTAICYLMVERTYRDVVAIALADEPPTRAVGPGVATRIVVSWASGSAVAVLGIALVAAEFLASKNMSPTRVAITILCICGAALVVGFATSRFVARSVADPLEAIRDALSEVEAGNTDVLVPVFDGSEVGLLQAGFNSMVAGLRERERLRDLFGRHVGQDVARQALARGIELGGETRAAAVLFIDIAGSTAFAARNEPAVVVTALNQFFAVVVDVTGRHGGWVNKFEGDAALCVFGALDEHPDAPAAALAAGRDIDAQLRSQLPDLVAGLGIAHGEVVAGNIGAADRYEYTVIGDPVNAAARLADLGKQRPERVLAADSVLDRANDEEVLRWRVAETITLRGRPTPTRIAVPVAR